MSAKRPDVIVGAFIVGMLLTPPDVISQTLLAIPIWLLFEVGIIFSKILIKNKFNSKIIFYNYSTDHASYVIMVCGPRSEISDSWLGQAKVNKWVPLLTLTVNLILVSLNREPFPKNPAQAPRSAKAEPRSVKQVLKTRSTVADRGTGP